MSPVMPHAQWMSLTNAGALMVRSGELSAVDNALAKYHFTKSAADKQALTAALLKWMQSKGNAWKTSARNKNHGVEILYAQLTGTGGVTLVGAERVGLSHVRDESRAIVEDLFHGKRLEWRASFKHKLGEQKIGTSLGTLTIIRSADTLSGGAVKGGLHAGASALQSAPGALASEVLPGAHIGGGGGGGMALAKDLLESLVPSDILPDVTHALAGLMPAFMAELAASLTPFVGVIVSGGGAVWATKNSLRSLWRLDAAQQHILGSLSKAEPAAALAALTRLLERERNRNVFAMGVGLADFGGKLAGLLADGGTATNAAIGLASSVIKLTNIIRIIVQDVLERNAANRQMLKRVDLKIFATCPVVGAYMVCCVPTSVLVNTIFDEHFGKVGWQAEVEDAAKHHLAPLKEQARRLVHEHRFWIPSLANHQGLLEVNKKKLEAMLARKGKSGMEGFGGDNLPDALKT